MKLISVLCILFVSFSAVTADLIIAVPQPITGEYAFNAQFVVNATTLWADTVNQNGGLTINAVQHNIVLQISKWMVNYDIS